MILCFLHVPVVSTETFESVKADFVDADMIANSCDKDIERRLTKLKFFNQTWLKDLSKTKTTMGKRKDHDVPYAAHDAVEESDDKVPAVWVLKAVTSSKEDIDAFNDWYFKKISESKIPKKSRSRFLSSSCAITEEMAPIIGEQVVTNTAPTKWKVDMDLVIVLLIALVNLMPKYPIRKHFPVPVTASTSVNPSSFPVSGFETVFTAADQSAECDTTEINQRDSARQALPGAVWWKKFGEFKKLELKVWERLKARQ